MTNINVNLTPKFINLTTEGGLDGSILNGKSYQRTFNMYEVENAGNRKMIDQVKDGGEFNDTTFQNSTGVGSFEVNLTFTADKILDAGTSYDQNGFVGVGAVLEINQAQAYSLNKYNYPALLFDANYTDGSSFTEGQLFIFTPDSIFENIAILVPAVAGNPVCLEDAIWNMPITATSFILGFEGP